MEQLDFRLVHEWPSDGLQLAYLAPATDDGFFLELMGGGSPTPKRDCADLDDSLCNAGYHHLCLHVDSIDETVAELRRRGVIIVREPFTLEPISRRLAFFADQWGNRPNSPRFVTRPGFARWRYDTKLWMRDLMEGAAYLPK